MNLKDKCEAVIKFRMGRDASQPEKLMIDHYIEKKNSIALAQLLHLTPEPEETLEDVIDSVLADSNRDSVDSE